MKKLTTEEVITRIKNIHGDKYSYSNLKYIGSKNKIIITCLKHGDFNTILDKIICGINCPKCSSELSNLRQKKTNDEFIFQAKKIHDDKYDNSLVDYYNNKSKVKIICPKHGIFEQRASSHIEGYGCPTCKESNGEREIRLFLESKDITYITQHRFNDCKNIYPLPFDFYLPDLNSCIEFNGKQHYVHNHFFVSKKGFNELENRDNIKMEYCKNNNIPLIIIKYDESINKILTNLFF
jgi:hypothetical protein